MRQDVLVMENLFYDRKIDKVFDTLHMVKVKSAYEPSGPSGRRLSRFCSIKRLGVLPLDGMPIYHRATPRITFADTHLYTWVDRGTARAKCLATKHNTMSSARARARTARSVDERTNHEASASPTHRIWRPHN